MFPDPFKELVKWFHGWFDPLMEYAYLAEWWVLLMILLAVCTVIGYFADFKWVKAVLGIVVLVAGAFVAGGTEMWRHVKNEGKKK
jgi:hypothetical protein